MTLIGKQFGSYQIIQNLGEGAISDVYKARRNSTESGMSDDVALKVIKPKLVNQDGLIERFQREATISSTLDHPNIIKVYEAGEIDGSYYLSMQFLSGGSLAQRANVKKLTLTAISAVLEQIASALDYAHAQQIVHRDLKPENILFDQNDNAILADFGMVKPLNQESITAKNTALGTPAYMSPEQCMLKPVDARSDIYSLGIILFELLTGELPFESNTLVAMMAMHVRHVPPLVSDKRSGTSAELDSVINKALAKNPLDRFSSAGELAAEFKRAIAPALPPPRKSTKMVSNLNDDRPLSSTAVPLSSDNKGQNGKAQNDSHNAIKTSRVGLLLVIVIILMIVTVVTMFLLGSLSI